MIMLERVRERRKAQFKHTLARTHHRDENVTKSPELKKMPTTTTGNTCVLNKLYDVAVRSMALQNLLGTGRTTNE